LFVTFFIEIPTKNELSENYLPIKELMSALKKNKLMVSGAESVAVESLEKDMCDKLNLTDKKKKKKKNKKGGK
jgi:hypothetical protein